MPRRSCGKLGCTASAETSAICPSRARIFERSKIACRGGNPEHFADEGNGSHHLPIPLRAQRRRRRQRVIDGHAHSDGSGFMKPAST